MKDGSPGGRAGTRGRVEKEGKAKSTQAKVCGDGKASVDEKTKGRKARAASEGGNSRRGKLGAEEKTNGKGKSGCADRTQSGPKPRIKGTPRRR